MKAQSSCIQRQSAGDESAVRESKTQPLGERDHYFKRRTIGSLDTKKTTSYNNQQVLNEFYQRILKKSNNFDPSESLDEAKQQNEDIYQYQPHIIAGKLAKVHLISEQQRVAYGLQDQNQCLVMIVADYQVVIVGKIGYLPIEGISVNLYLPRKIHEYIHMKSSKKKETPIPERLIIVEGRPIVIVKRQYIAEDPTNILNYPYLVVDPVNLLYPSLICNWIECKRRIVLVNYIQGQKQVNQHLVYGSTCHRLLEWLAQRKISVAQFQTQKQIVCRRLYDSMLYDMYLIKKSYTQFMDACRNGLDNITNFFKTHIIEKTPLQVNRYNKVYLTIQRLVSSQEMFRSKFLGLKGKIDLLLSGQYVDQKQKIRQHVFVPMELKTGKKMSFAHKRQTQIYNILVRQHYKKPVLGLLYYSESNKKYFVQESPFSAFEIVVIHRNQIVQNYANVFRFPSKLTLPKFNFNQCQFCEVINSCQTIFKEIESDNNMQIYQLPSKYAKKQVNYTKEQLGYLAKWLKLIHLQENQVRLNLDISTKMNISSFKMPSNQIMHLKKTNLNRIKFVIQHRCRSLQQIQVFQDYYKTSMKVRAHVSSVNLIQGCKISEITIQIESKKFKITLEMNNLEIQYSTGKLQYFKSAEEDLDVQIQTFQNNLFATMRNTIVDLVSQQNSFVKDLVINSEHNHRVLQLDESEDDQIPLSIGIQNSQYEGMNEDQILAYQTAFHEQKFCLIQGMPGTGKTQLIIKLILKFNSKKKRMLITAFTNRSLDNILQRLIATEKVENSTIIRQGSLYSSSKKLKQFTSKSHKFQNLQDYESYFNSKNIWFVTLNSLFIHHLPKQFDIVIIDEASQCLEPVCIQGLKRAKKFIMIGDYRQLQPIVKSKQAYRQEMQLSLFERLCKKYPLNTVSLNKQYRMNSYIMSISNNLVYGNKLELADQKMKNNTIRIIPEWKTMIPQQFQEVFQPEKPVVFINYDPIIESVTNKFMNREFQIRKFVESQIPSYVYKQFLNLKIQQSDMSIIAAQNSSLNLIYRLLKRQRIIQQNHGSILTIDKSQGIDKQVIIMLIERGNQQLIQNPRRLNVALTRAKNKLIIIGSKFHLEQMKVWNGTLQKLLRPYKMDFTKQMVQKIISALEHNDPKRP